jgi:hypothetical protein
LGVSGDLKGRFPATGTGFFPLSGNKILYTNPVIKLITMAKEYVKPELIDLNEQTGTGRADCMNGSGDAAICQTGTAAGTYCLGGSGVIEGP